MSDSSSAAPDASGGLSQGLASLRIDRKDRARTRGLFVPALVLLLLAGAGYAAWRVKDQFLAIEVTTTEVKVERPSASSGGRRSLLVASGYVVARRKAVVSAKIQGRLSELRVEEGSKLAEGDVIARLESLDYEAQVERAKANVARSEAELAEDQRKLRLTERLVENSVSSGDDLEAARSRVRISEANLRQSKADLGVFEAYLQNTYIRAPFAGVVIKKMAEVGESVAPIPPGVNVSTSSGAIVALADFATLEMEADVNEANIAKLAAEQPAEVTVEALPEKRYRAVLRQIIPSADRTKATVLVKVTLFEKDENLRPEMSARVNFLERDVPPAASPGTATGIVTIPASAVVVSETGLRVFEVREGRALARTVTLGEKYGSDVLVKSGLSGGEKIITNPPKSLCDGDPVKFSN